MKKLSFLLATFGLAVATLTGGGTAFADTVTCDIGFTGPDSKNICTSTTEFTCKVINNNNIEFYNGNDQVAVSGDTTVGGNTTGGGATSGTATNANGTSFNWTVTNGSGEETGQICSTVVTKPANVTPETPGMGAVTPQAVQPAATPVTPGRGQAVTPVALPNTSSISPVAATLMIATIASGLLAATRYILLARQ